jgi:hypothetical protein
MDSKQILNKIITMLGMEGKQVELEAFGNGNAVSPIYGKLEGGGAVKADFWDLGHMVFVVKEDGSEVPAPDADHIIYLPIGLAGGNKRYFITTKGGVITSMNLEDTHNGVKKDVNASAQTNSEMEKTLTTEELGAMKDYNEAQAVKKETMAVDPAQRLDALEAEVKQLRDDIASLFESQKKDPSEDMNALEMGVKVYDEEAAVKEIQKVDESKGGKLQMSNSAKKFTGAPVEETTNLSGLFKSKKEGTMLGSVLAKMSNSKF